MAITQLSQTPIGTTDFTQLKDEITKNAKGINPISLSNYDTDSAPVVKIGSVFENNGATFIVDSSDITPTGYGGIANSTTFYLYYDESANTFIYSATVPTWNDALQGSYNGNDRALFSMYKDSGGTLYKDKHRLEDITKRNIITKYHNSSSTTSGAVFTALSGWVPTTGGYLPCEGQFQFATTIKGTLMQIERNSSTSIQLKFLNATTAVVSEQAVIDGNASAFAYIEIMSKYNEAL
jgi:hypothetical protein